MLLETAKHLQRLRGDANNECLVVTTYLDTEDHHYLGLAQQRRDATRMRIREYVTRHTPTGKLSYQPTCFLERKQCIDKLRIKHRVEIPKGNAHAIVSGKEHIEDFGCESQEIAAELSSFSLRPVLTCIYRRQTFGQDGGLRVTHDSQLCFFEPKSDLYETVPVMTPSALKSLPTGTKEILEIKQPTTDSPPDWLNALTQQLQPADEFSKFLHGMAKIETQRDEDEPNATMCPIDSVSQHR